MRRLRATFLIALFTGAILTSSGGCSAGACAAVLRGDEVVYRVRRSVQTPALLQVQLAEGQEMRDIHREGWYLSDAYMSRIFELLDRQDDRVGP